MRGDSRTPVNAMNVAVACAILAILGGAAYFHLTIHPVHTDAGAVPSTLAVAPSEQYLGALEKVGSQARTLSAVIAGASDSVFSEITKNT